MRNLLFVICLFCTVAHAQQIHFFGDTLKRLRPAVPSANIINKGIYSYIPNKATDGTSGSVTTLIKIDTSGKTLWTAFPTNYVTSGTELPNISMSSIMAANDNNIYAWFNNNKLGKIRESNGSLDWLVPLQPVIGLSRASLIDYDLQTVLFANAAAGVNNVRLIRYDKSKGQNLGYVDLPVTSPGAFGIYIASPNIYVANGDSVYKFTSFENPVMEWKVKSGTDRYMDIQSMSLEGNNLLVFGNKESGFHNGMVSCIDVSTPTLKWFIKNGGAYDLQHADHKIKNGFLYTAWKHLYVGSITETCFINRIDIAAGTKSWESNFKFRTQPVFVSIEEAMTSMDIDNNETLFLSGYGLPDGQTAKAWALMKIKGSTGEVVQRNFVSGSDASQDYPVGISSRLVNNKLYATGQMPGTMALACIDTAGIVPLKITPLTATIQFTSSVVGMRNVSLNKKVLVKKVGKSLKVEMQDPYLNKIWESTIGDTLYPYEGIDIIGVNDATKTSYITGRRYEWAASNQFYFSLTATPDTFFLMMFDSTGAVTGRFAQKDNPIQFPYQFFQDSIQRTWFGRFAGTDQFARVYPTLEGSVSGKRTPRPYTLIKPTTYFPYTNDTVLLFREPTGSQVPASLLKTWPGYLPVANATYHYIYTVRWFNSADREDKDNFYVAAKDSSLQDMIFKYSLKDSTIIWSKKYDPSILTLKGYCSNGSFYALSTQGATTFIRKFNGTTGDVIWTKNIDVLPGHTLTIGDFAMSKQRQKITLAGYLTDTLIKDMSQAYIITFDTSGNVLNTFISEGYSAWQNKATTIHIGQDGQTLVGGQMTDSIAGYAGFIYEVDSTSLKINIPAPQVLYAAAGNSCSDTTRLTGKILNPLPAPYNMSIVQDNTTVLAINPADSTFRYSIANAGNHTIKVTYSYGVSSSYTDTSFTIKATPATGAAPVQNGNIVTAPATGNSYQWYLNGNIITGAITNTITVSQSGLYKYTYTIDGCTAAASPELNVVYTSIIDPYNNNAVITISPNPTNGIVIIKHLNPAYQYGIKVTGINGIEVRTLTYIPRGASSSIDLHNLAHGNYILQLYNINKNLLIGSQKLVLVK